VTLPSERNTRWPTYAAWAAVILFYIVVRVQLLDVPLDRDEGVFGSIGQGILRGELPYRDLYDHKPPGLYYLIALAVALGPDTAAGLPGFLHVWNFLALIALALLARRMAGPKAALWTAAIYAVISAAPSVQGFTASAELLAIAPFAGSLAVAAYALAADGRKRDLLMIAAGALAGFAFLIKPPYALPILATLLFLRAEGGARWKRDAIAWVAGGAILGVLVALAFAGVWKEFWYWNATHNAAYRDQSWDGWRGRLSMVIGILTPDLVVPFLLAAAGCAWAFMKRQRYALFLAVLLVLSALSCVQSGYLYLHYFAQVLAALALAAGIGATVLADAVSRNVQVRRAAAVVLALIVLAVPVASRRWYWINPNPIAVTLQVIGPQAFEASPLIADHLREQTRPDDSIWLFGNEPQILFLAQRRNASPFAIMYPLIFPYPRRHEFQERSWAAVQAANPAYIVVSRERAIMPRPDDMDPFIEQRLEQVKPRYALEGCLALMENDQLLLHTDLDKSSQPCPGRTIIELWRRKT
jgi:4-amino-4-deoxy-L-arabinose transferase-like glycosyltransferase